MRAANLVIRASIGAAVAILATCAAAVAVGSPRATAAEVLNVDFESYPLGLLGAPWIVTVNTGATSASTAAVVSTPDHGKALRLHGNKLTPDFLIASLGLSSSAPEIRVEVDVKPDPGASFIWSLHGAGPSIGSRRIRLQQAPGGTGLAAQTSPSGTTPCGAVASNAWSRVTLTVHTQAFPHTFDVRINGAPTGCTGTTSRIGPPFNSVSVMDPSNEGWGGDVLFDNIVVTEP